MRTMWIRQHPPPPPRKIGHRSWGCCYSCVVVVLVVLPLLLLLLVNFVDLVVATKASTSSDTTTTATLDIVGETVDILDGSSHHDHVDNDVVTGELYIDTTIQYQTIEGFGASIAWYTDRLVARPDFDDIITILFDDLALDILRIRNVYDKEEEDSIQEIQNIVKILQAATTQAMNHPLKILLSSWSPPSRLKSNDSTRNGGTLIKRQRLQNKTSNDNNNDDENGSYDYEQYAQWWVDSLMYYESQLPPNISIDLLSIQNEPNFMTAQWETCRFDPTENDDYAGYDRAFYSVYQALAQTYNNNNKTKMPKMIGPETVGFTQLSQYIDNLLVMDDNMLYGYAHHLYEKDVGWHPNALNNEMAAFYNRYNNKPIFQTEYSIVEPPSSSSSLLPDEDIQRKLNLARLMHNALTMEHVAAYMYWALYWIHSPEGLVTIPPPILNDEKDEPPPPIVLSPEYHTFRQYSAFIHGGWNRIATTLTLTNNNSRHDNRDHHDTNNNNHFPTPPPANITVSAYQSNVPTTSDHQQEVTVVVSNENAFAVYLNLTFITLLHGDDDDSDRSGGSLHYATNTGTTTNATIFVGSIYRTSTTENCEWIGNYTSSSSSSSSNSEEELLLLFPPMSITTLALQLRAVVVTTTTMETVQQQRQQQGDDDGDAATTTFLTS